MEYLRNCENASGAYRTAKPKVSNKTAEVEACKLLKNPNFSKVLEEERKRWNQKIDMNFGEWMEELLWIAHQRPEKVETHGKLKALELIGKSKGFLTDRMVLSAGKPIEESIVATIAKLRSMPDLPKLTSEDLDKLLECEIVTDE